MTKKVLMLAAKANMIQQFNHRNIKILQHLGYEVHVATNMVDFGSMSNDENERFKQWMRENNIVAHQIDFERRMGSFKGNIRSIQQLRKVFKENRFVFTHLHSPLGSILGRLVAKQYKIPVIYTAHGFHFFKGGSKSSWLFFYPLEWIFSFMTDTLITINDEDYALAMKHMHARKIIKINGIGVDVERAWEVTDEEKAISRKKIREELNIPDDAFLMSSVGELSVRKNHKVVLEALKKMTPNQRQNIYYVIAGTGTTGNMLKQLAENFNFGENLKLLGYRSDIHDINYASDVSVFPSLREGLGIAGLDSCIDGTFLLATNKGGVVDYLKEGVNGYSFSPNDSETLKLLILKSLSVGQQDWKKLKLLENFDSKKIDNKMVDVYKYLTK